MVRKWLVLGGTFLTTFLIFGCSEVGETNVSVVKEAEEVEEDSNQYPFSIVFSDKNSKPISENYRYEDDESLISREYVLEITRYLIYDLYIKELGLTEDFFKDLIIEVVDGKVVGTDNGMVLGVYSFHKNHIVISTNQSDGDFFRTLSHEIGHFIDYNLFKISDFDQYIFYRDGLQFEKEYYPFFKSYYDSENLDLDYIELHNNVKELFAYDFSSLFDLPDDTKMHYLKEEFFGDDYIEKEDKEVLMNMLKERIKWVEKMKEGILIDDEWLKEINGKTYINILTAFFSVNYIGDYIDKDEQAKEQPLKLIRNERKYSGNEYHYIFNSEDNTVTINNKEFKFEEDEFFIGGFVPLSIFDLEESDIYYKETDEGFYLFRKSYE